MRGEDRGVFRQAINQSVRGVPLIVCLLHREIRSNQIRTADGAVEQRATGEHHTRVLITAHREGHVMRRMARGMHDRDVKVADPEGVFVAYRNHICFAEVGEVHIRRNHVLRSVQFRQLVPTIDIVIVDMGFGDVGECESVLGKDALDTVSVALGVNHERVNAVVNYITAITKSGSIDGDDMRCTCCNHESGSCRKRHTGRTPCRRTSIDVNGFHAVA